MLNLIPSKTQWKRWSLPSKLGCIGTYVGIFSLLLAVVFYLWPAACAVNRASNTLPEPNFRLSLRLGNSPASTVFLTNDFLFDRRIVKVGVLPNGSSMFNTYVYGCLVIPVQQGESNKVFNFTAENDSRRTVNDLQVTVGFPKDWACGVDPKWHKVGASLIIPDAWTLDATNLQYWAVQSPWVLFPYDSLNFPSITNSCTPEYIGHTFKGGFVELFVRSSGFEGALAANIIFVPDESNLLNPFVALGHPDSNGVLHISPEEIEASQK